MSEALIFPNVIPAKTPVEAVANAKGSSLAEVAWQVAVAALFALLFGSQAIVNWADRLPVNDASDLVGDGARWWDAQMTSLGTPSLAEAARAAWRRLDETP
jgi:hypothetical protein